MGKVSSAGKGFMVQIRPMDYRAFWLKAADMHQHKICRRATYYRHSQAEVRGLARMRNFLAAAVMDPRNFYKASRRAQKYAIPLLVSLADSMKRRGWVTGEEPEGWDFLISLRIK